MSRNKWQKGGNMLGRSSRVEPKVLVDFHFRCLQGMYFSEYMQGEGYILLFSDLVEDSYYNYIAHISGDLETVLEEARPLFASRNRSPALYITPWSEVYKEKNMIPDTFSEWAADAWMILDDSQPLIDLREYRYPEYVEIEPVHIADRDEYVRVFEHAYTSGDPDDPYGALPAYYGESLWRSFDTGAEGYEKEYVWAKIDGEPVGIGSMLWDDQVAGVYGIGTIPPKQNLGVGTSIMSHLVKRALAKEIPNMVLQTEVGSYVEKWYVKRGFKTIFAGTYYTEKT